MSARAALAVAAATAVLAPTLAVTSALPAAAATGGQNARTSHSVLYTRPCLDFSDRRCRATVVRPGGTIPRSSRLYLMPGDGWRACSIVGGRASECVTGSTYRRVSLGRVWLVRAV